MSVQRVKNLAAVVALLAIAGCATNPAVPKDQAEVTGQGGRVVPVAEVMGASASGLDTLLGAPALTRREGQGEFRRYGLHGCSLVVILYPDADGTMRAAHLDATAKRSGDKPLSVEDCLATGLVE